MKTLKEIKSEIGNETYQKWLRCARRELSLHPMFWNHAEARHACIYESIIRQYSDYCNSLEEGRRASVHASDAPLPWEALG